MLLLFVIINYICILFSINYLFLYVAGDNPLILISFIPLLLIICAGWKLRSSVLKKVPQILKRYANSLMIIQFAAWSSLLTLKLLEISKLLSILNILITIAWIVSMYLAYQLDNRFFTFADDLELERLSSLLVEDSTIQFICKKNRLYIPLYILIIPGNGQLFLIMFLIVKVLMIKPVVDIYRSSSNKKYILFTLILDVLGLVIVWKFTDILDTYSMLMLIVLLKVPDSYLKTQILEKYEC